MAIELIIPLISGAAATAAAELLKKVKVWYDARQKLKTADERRFQAALSSNSLAELGGYLDKSIGRFSVAEYAQNHAVRDRVNNFLARLEDYVGKSGDIPSQQAAPAEKPEPFLRASDPDLDSVESRIEAGAVWDALSALRRTIELRLSTLAKENAILLPQKLGAGRMLQFLQQRELVPGNVGEELRFAIDVANRGVHGLDVGTDEALEALRNARDGLAKLERMEK
jgi:hypothetical protein